MECNGLCNICANPCFRGEVKGNQREISPNLEIEIQEISNVNSIDKQPSEKGLAIVENIGEYEVARNIFGKEKVRKLK